MFREFSLTSGATSVRIDNSVGFCVGGVGAEGAGNPKTPPQSANPIEVNPVYEICGTAAARSGPATYLPFYEE